MSLKKMMPYVSNTVWGGQKLSKFKNIPPSLDNPIGETWEVSSLKGASSKILGKDLSDFINLPYLIKFIDTSKNLSVQVHPGDNYAKEHENSLGKNEAWLIMDCEENASIFVGFKDGVTKKEFKLALESGLSVDVFLNEIKVHPGQLFYIPVGTVHAIGSGITLLEVQQSSGVTYRVWDWNRLGLDGKPRELHVAKAFDVLNFNGDFNRKVSKTLKENIFKESIIYRFNEFSNFEFSVMHIEENKKIELKLDEKESLVCLEGTMECDEEEIVPYSSYISLENKTYSIYSRSKSIICLVKEK